MSWPEKALGLRKGAGHIWEVIKTRIGTCPVPKHGDYVAGRCDSFVDGRRRKANDIHIICFPNMGRT